MTPATLKSVENALVEDPAFGDSAGLRARAATFYRLTLHLASRRSPEAAAFLAAYEAADETRARRALWDPVVRSAIHERVGEPGEHVFSPEDSGEVLAAAAAWLRGETDDPLTRGAARVVRLLDDGEGPFVWWTRKGADVHGRLFRKLYDGLMLPALAAAATAPADPDDATLATLADGVRLLRALLPRLTESALAHSRVVVFFDLVEPAAADAGLVRSSSYYLFPATTFFSPGSFVSPWAFAVDLLHESIHHKFYDFAIGKRALAPRSPGDPPSRTIRAPWNPPSEHNPNEWPIRRALSAFVVYAHLALFARAADARREELERAFGPRKGADAFLGPATERAAYLGGRLLAQGEGELGADGLRYAGWLLERLAEVDPDGVRAARGGSASGPASAASGPAGARS